MEKRDVPYTSCPFHYARWLRDITDGGAKVVYTYNEAGVMVARSKCPDLAIPGGNPLKKAHKRRMGRIVPLIHSNTTSPENIEGFLCPYTHPLPSVTLLH